MHEVNNNDKHIQDQLDDAIDIKELIRLHEFRYASKLTPSYG